MWKKETPQNLIDNYKKRQQVVPIVISILAFLLVIVGVVIVILWVTGGGFSFLGKKSTPTSVMPPTPVLSPTPSIPPTETPTATSPITATPSGPFEYEVKSNDTCWGIHNTFKVDLATLLAINNFPNGTCPIIPGQKILIPSSGQSLPTQTPFPADLKAGTKINYTVQAGDSLGSIANRFHTTIADIVNYNKTKITDQNNIPVGIVLVIRVNIVTPTPTFAPTSTRAGVSLVTPLSTATQTIKSTP
jgi:LysM repeat protein